FSAAQLNILSLSIFLAKALHAKHKEEPIESIFIDDPIHSMDSINILSTIDLLRNISTIFGRQIIISTHNYNFHELLKKKLPPEIFGSKFIYLESFGKVAPH
ncbi:exonuclease SbcC, partial [Yersinia enterocolitica]|nr:exonuclease SbcC [Yersinia enterocolitica]